MDAGAGELIAGLIALPTLREGDGADIIAHI
jgi:hypothetical protein